MPRICLFILSFLYLLACATQVHANYAFTHSDHLGSASWITDDSTAHPQIEQYGGTIKGNNGNNIGLPNGTEIPPKVDVVRPNNLTE